VVGGYVKIVAITAGGIELLARAARTSLEESELEAGAEVEVTWRRESVHVYPWQPPSDLAQEAAGDEA
jgi:hypothetical protein